VPVQFSIKDKQYEYPEGYQDVTLERFIASIKEIGEMPEVLKQYYAAKDEEELKAARVEIFKEGEKAYKFELMPYFIKYVSFWCELPMTVLGTAKSYHVKLAGVEVRDNYRWIETLHEQIYTNLLRSEKDCEVIVPSIEHKGQTWFLPTHYMSKSTVNGAIELFQYQHNAHQLGKSQFEVLPEMLCILLQKTPDARYNPKQLERKGLFMDITMDKAAKVSFFLLNRSEILLENSLIYTAALRLSYLQSNAGQA
jgi:hypothetical protein